MKNRLIEHLKSWGGQIGVDLHHHSWFNDIHPTLTIRTVPSDNYYIIENMNYPINTDKDDNARTITTQYGKKSQNGMLNSDRDKLTCVEVLGWTRDAKGNVVNRHPVDVANCVTSGKRSNTQNYVKENVHRIRKLTPHECFRLMGVADTDIDTLLASGISNSQLYKLAGNSIVVNVLEEIFKNLFYKN